MSELEQEHQFDSLPVSRASEDINDLTILANLEVIAEEVEWLSRIIETRLALLEGAEDVSLDALELSKLPDVRGSKAAYALVIDKLKLSYEERLLFILSFIPYYNPALLTKYFRAEQHTLQVKYPEVGGFIKGMSRQFVPTIQTFQFLLCGDDHQEATKNTLLLRAKSKLFTDGIVKEQSVHSMAEPENDHEEILTVSGEYIDHLRSSKVPRPKFGPTFPAQLVESNYDWDDVVFHEMTRQQFEPLMDWLRNQEVLSMRSNKWKVVAPILFYGSPGTGKSMTAQLIGKTLGRDVFRVDLSMIVSKYVGETEKNLAHLFNKAENKDWVLFFDEADGLFAKRTGVSNANDKWANMGVNYLLQRMESFKGISILATNIKENLDPAMSRRFRYMVKFPRPRPIEQRQLWKKLLPSYYSYADDVNMTLLCQESLSGANISNIILDCAVSAEKLKTDKISMQMIHQCVIRELQKEDRTANYIVKNEIHPALMHQASMSNGAEMPASASMNVAAQASSQLPETNGQQSYSVDLSPSELDLIRKHRQQKGG